jgi:hypothetical protein
VPHSHTYPATVAEFIPGARNKTSHPTISILPLWLYSFLVPRTKRSPEPYLPCHHSCIYSLCLKHMVPQFPTTSVTVATFIPDARNLRATAPYYHRVYGCLHSLCPQPNMAYNYPTLLSRLPLFLLS